MKFGKHRITFVNSFLIEDRSLDQATLKEIGRYHITKGASELFHMRKWDYHMHTEPELMEEI